MGSFKVAWIAQVITGALGAIIAGLFLAWFFSGDSRDATSTKSSDTAPKAALLQPDGPDYSDLTERIKIEFDGLDGSTASRFTGIPHLIFTFTNLSPKTAKISGSKGCNFVKWRYSRYAQALDKSATLNQNGSSIIRVPAQTTKKISYSVDLLDPPAFDSANNANSVCKFWVGFGGSSIVHETTAIANSPIPDQKLSKEDTR